MLNPPFSSGSQGAGVLAPWWQLVAWLYDLGRLRPLPPPPQKLLGTNSSSSHGCSVLSSALHSLLLLSWMHRPLCNLAALGTSLFAVSAALCDILSLFSLDQPTLPRGEVGSRQENILKRNFSWGPVLQHQGQRRRVFPVGSQSKWNNLPL